MVQVVRWPILFRIYLMICLRPRRHFVSSCFMLGRYLYREINKRYTALTGEWQATESGVMPPNSIQNLHLPGSTCTRLVEPYDDAYIPTKETGLRAVY